MWMERSVFRIWHYEIMDVGSSDGVPGMGTGKHSSDYVHQTRIQETSTSTRKSTLQYTLASRSS